MLFVSFGRHFECGSPIDESAPSQINASAATATLAALAGRIATRATRRPSPAGARHESASAPYQVSACAATASHAALMAARHKGHARRRTSCAATSRGREVARQSIRRRGGRWVAAGPIGRKSVHAANTAVVRCF